ncbi:phosphotransferase family protein [Mycobacterium sp. CVI_P3]|uniref:Phosphotransferase family protein n=1 Tax=Mycobacterium pinniadriaticum TaxID=2994102 RepID=A0ABT3SGJ2_9MYCO|nr:phosphotransferase family protein [Mycobacterium pinniadriaticum]MCX2931621.1 phosphotransferase family protein [Mycobacterium pinniadriaticum]MCX2937987.1 phosphotransferase family protein [Mycobacterium pinniadriaticum]
MTGELLDALQRRLAPRDITALRPLAGGASSLTFAGHFTGRRVVVKVAPPGLAPTAHRDVLRQARIIRALWTTGVPVPEVLLEDPGDPPDTPPLFVMSFSDGTSVEPLFDTGDAGPSAVVAERFRRAAATMAALHRLSPAGLGLGGEPVVAPAAEVDKWCRTLNTVDPELAPGWQRVSDALQVSAPPAIAPAVVHGDFRLGNLLADEQGVTAVIDWEIWSVGDPRVDLGWFLINSDTDTYDRITPYRGLTPPVADLIDEYRKAFAGDISGLKWFRALACFKSTATWSLIVKHNRRRATPDPGLEAMAARLPAVLTKAGEYLS